MTSALQTATVVARLVARREDRAVPVVETRRLADDPPRAFGIAPIKMVSEEVLQSVAFGVIGEEPDVVVRWNPLSRDVEGLERMAVSLDQYLRDQVTADELPRVWLPHGSALSLMEVFGHRYRTNREASEELRTLGRHCITIATEARFEGQQAVAVGADVLREHVVTGQSPVEDGHLGALLAWVEPDDGRTALETAQARALVPASGVLVREVDDRVEALRRTAKGRDAAAARARAEIEELLRGGARAEWDLLMACRRAIFDLPLTPLPGIETLVAASKERLAYRITNPVAPPSRAPALARMVDENEHAADVAEDVVVRGDGFARRVARSKGRIVAGTLESVTWGRRPKFRPCSVVVRTDQPVLRLRRGTRLHAITDSVDLRLIDENEDGDDRLLTFDVSTGVRTVDRWRLGMDLELTDSSPIDFSVQMGRARRTMQTANTPLVFADDLPPQPAVPPPADDLLARARRLRRP